MMKVMTIVGTRPEVIRLSRVIVALDQHTDHIFVHTGQNYDYELNQIFFDELNLRKPDHCLNAIGKNAIETVGLIIIRVDKLLATESPDAILVLGDTNSCLAVYPAKRRKIPVFHMEAGNRCFDERVPEEINRRIVDHISDINMTYSSISREHLMREGFPPDRIIKTGTPMFEVLQYYMPKIEQSSVLTRLSLRPMDYFVLSCHREENVDNERSFKELVKTSQGLASCYGRRVIVTAHPRTRKRIEQKGIALPSLVELHKPFGLIDYVKLEMNAQAVLSDSGTITEESSILNFPALNIRQSHERAEGMEEGSVMMTGLNFDRIMQGLEILRFQGRGETRTVRMVDDYNVPNVSEKVVRIIVSYTDYVNRVVWQE